jgi:alkylation response protein AidB-like acyl-CoA dehydrogenase
MTMTSEVLSDDLLARTAGRAAGYDRDNAFPFEDLADLAAAHRRTSMIPRLVGLKVRATENARYVIDRALRVGGGASYFAGNELGRLYRDVLAGIFHPSDGESAHATVANAWLGPLQRD